MTARILKTLTLTLVLGGVFAASASAMQIAEPSIYSARLSKPSAAPVVPIVSEKVAGLHAAVPTATLAVSDRGVLTAKDAGLQSQSPAVLVSSGDGFNWSDAGIGAGVMFAVLLVLTGVALTTRRHHPVAH